VIAHLRGSVAVVGSDYVVVDVCGVGYKCLIPSSTRLLLPGTGQEVLLQTSLQVREDSMTLFGFGSSDEFDLFELLLRVEGIGPKVALGVLSASNPDAFRRAIAFDDLTALCRIPGIGKKTAGRLVLELKDKLGGLELSDGRKALHPQGLAVTPGNAGPFAEALDALEALGYSRGDAGTVLERARPEAGDEPSTETLVRLGLKHLFRG
jgi:holliday junction DNA helicase RuvA